MGPAASPTSCLAVRSKRTRSPWQDEGPDSHSSSSSSSSTSDGHITPRTSNGAQALTPVEPPAPQPEEPQRKKRGRKGHSKSRTGCFNCKRARIKCKENRPSCDYCAHRGLQCEWPDIQISHVSSTCTTTTTTTTTITTHAAALMRPSPSHGGIDIPAALQQPTPAGLFTMQDFRLFNHFIQAAYPHHPIGNDSVWTHEIPSIAADHDFLLHSMLALAASDLAAAAGGGSGAGTALACTAMTHRLAAIASLNAAISRGIRAFEQGNAMLATCYALLFQSTFIADGLVEYMTFIRGCLVVGAQMGKGGMRFLFHGLWGDDNVRAIDPALTLSPLVDAASVRGCVRSLERLAPLCRAGPEVDIYGLLLGTARALFTSSRDAYMELRKIYVLFSYTMSHADFASFTSPTNTVAKLLQSHFVALQLIMTPIAKLEQGAHPRPPAPQSPEQGGDGTTVRWLGALHRHIPPEMLAYYEWPLFVEAEVRAGRIVS